MEKNKNKIDLVPSEKEPVKVATIIGIITALLNLGLGVSKRIIGKTMGYNAVFSDGIHSTGDVLTTIIAVISVWVAAKKSSRTYNYGHERWASIACLVLAIILFVTAGEIIIESSESLAEILKEGNNGPSSNVGSPFFYASLSLAIASVAIKFIRFFITRYGAKKAHSKARVADAWHQIIDALSSIAAIIALTGFYYRNGKNILDPILSYPIAVRVIFIGIETFKQSTRELTDHAIDHDKRKEVKDILSKYIERSKIKEVKSRIFSEKFYLDIVLLEDQEKTLKEADRLSDQRKEDLRKHFDNLKDVTIRTIPDNPEHQKKNY